MVRLVVRRLLLGVFILFGVSLFVFILLYLAPGDPAQAIAGPYASQQVVEAFRERYGLNDPLPVQYLRWLGRVVRGDLGNSPTLGTPIGPLVLSRFRNTLILAGSSLTMAILAGLAIGVAAGTHSRSVLDRLLMGISLFFANIPEYLLALVLVYLLALQLQLLPASGMQDLRNPGGLPDLLAHLILPSTAVALGPMVIIARMTRGSILEVSQADYVTMARATGISNWKVTLEYILLNALPAILSVIGLQVGTLLGGAIFAEIVFSWPGLGQQLFNAVVARDIPTVQAATLVVATSFVLVNLLTDLAVLGINPRMRHS
ncbi:MAG: ABC transporter permease [Ardenticatenaceae bacterium]|nr:ABC transporter permease [Ardenticatenaceae bacterium]HBY97518.1 glutathione ABC transporter permease GsiC [Chloroflexota bacterium]